MERGKKIGERREGWREEGGMDGRRDGERREGWRVEEGWREGWRGLSEEGGMERREGWMKEGKWMEGERRKGWREEGRKEGGMLEMTSVQREREEKTCLFIGKEGWEERCRGRENEMGEGERHGG